MNYIYIIIANYVIVVTQARVHCLISIVVVLLL